MLEQQINIWDAIEHSPICITTNGFVKKNGENVMGRGCALELQERCPKFPKQLGKMIPLFGNKTIVWDLDETPGLPNQIITFPVKHNWWDKADLDLIIKSSKDLIQLMNYFKFDKVYLPRPGCGWGWLDWEKDVKPAIKDILDDRVIVTWI